MKRALLALVLSMVSFSGAYAQKGLEVVTSKDAPKAIGPYSQAIHAGNMVYASGQIGLIPETGMLAGNDITSQTRQALNNLKAVLAAAGTDMSHIVKVTIYLKDLEDYAKVNDIYKEYFTDLKPARSTVQVARLPKDALIEVDCIAVSGN